jgi:DNA-directed RNA polymerase specialized sigma subunit
MEAAYENWKKDPTPERMGDFLEKAQPVISSALQSYGRGNQALESRARILTAKAVKTYDSTKGTKLKTYLMTQLQPLNRISRDYSAATRVPERVSVDLYSVNQGGQEYFNQYGREASDKELADMTGLSMRRIAHVRKFSKSEMGESAMTDDEGAIMYPGTESPDPEKILLEYLHHDLDPVDQKILEWRSGLYGKKQISNNEIARRVNLSPGAVSQRAAKIAARIAAVKAEGVTGG